jgi:uncharacterized OB-fold protein
MRRTLSGRRHSVGGLSWGCASLAWLTFNRLKQHAALADHRVSEPVGAWIMTVNLDQVEPLTLKGQIAVPYTWWVGELGSRFLIALRDEAKIIGNRCARCNTVYVPPRKNCGSCFVDIDQFVELGNEGIVTAYTIVRFSYPLHPVAPPFAYAVIKLDGADVGFTHIIKDDLDKLGNNVRVRARFKDRADRTGNILDIDCFQLI